MKTIRYSLLRRALPGLLFFAGFSQPAPLVMAAPPPYPMAEIGIRFDAATYYTPKPGCRSGRAPECLGDNWPTTETEDGALTVWGDGVGPGGQGRKGFDVSLGIARLDKNGTLPSDGALYFGAVKDKRCRSDIFVDGRLCGKSYGIIADDMRLSMWLSPGSGRWNYREAVLVHSLNFGETFEVTGPRLDGSSMILPTFAQFPFGYTGEYSSHFYIYGAKGVRTDGDLVIQRPGEIVAYRVPRNRLNNQDHYEDLGTVFRDLEGGVGWTVSVRYDSVIRKFVLMTEHTQTMKSKLGIYISDSPTGPWKTVAHYKNWSRRMRLSPVGANAFHWNILGPVEGTDRFRVVFSGTGDDDTYQMIEARWK